MTNRMPELLCPAGNLESLEAALHFGADAVYGGMRQFGLRAFAGNFDEEALTQAVEKMHGAGKKFYLTMNIFPFDDQLDDSSRRRKQHGTSASMRRLSAIWARLPPCAVKCRSCPCTSAHRRAPSTRKLCASTAIWAVSA